MRLISAYRGYIVFFVLFSLCLPVPVFSQSSSASSLPGISNISAEEHQRDFPFAPRRRLWARFVIDNPELVPFILRVSLTNGSFLYSWYNVHVANPSIRMRDLELVYRNQANAPVVRPFVDAAAKSDGYIYEFQFWQEDVQAIYNMELWAILDPVQDRGAPAGTYQEIVNFEIIDIVR